MFTSFDSGYYEDFSDVGKETGLSAEQLKKMLKLISWPIWDNFDNQLIDSSCTAKVWYIFRFWFHKCEDFIFSSFISQRSCNDKSNNWLSLQLLNFSLTFLIMNSF